MVIRKKFFARRNKLEIELFLYLLERFGRVSWEMVVSGPELYNIYQFLRDTAAVPSQQRLSRRCGGRDRRQ